MRHIRQIAICAALMASTSTGFISCDKYYYVDDLQALGQRVEILEQMTLEANTQIEALNELIITIEKRGYVTNAVKNTDGSTTVTFNSGKTFTLRNGKDGKDGKDGVSGRLDISAAEDPTDNIWYWTINGSWLLDDNGNKMRAGGLDGKDGKDGVDGKDGKDGKDGVDGKDGANGRSGYVVVPQVRINPVTRYWEISTDGSQTWHSTGYLADGKDGKDGADGKDGKDGADGKDGNPGPDGKEDIFKQIIVSDDYKSITFVLNDGRSFTVPYQPY